MPSRVFLAILIALSSLLLTACERSLSLAAAPAPIAPTAPAITRTPSGIFISTSVPALVTPPTASAGTSLANSAVFIVQGRVFDAGSGQRLSNATIEWQFLALDWQAHNGQQPVPVDGLYRLQLPVRSDDVVIITARAPGYLPSLARLLGKQLSPYGSRLNFGLLQADGPLPTLPGALGTIQLSGIVYNSARGLTTPIEQARVMVVNRSVVQPETKIAATTSVTGSFVMPLTLHTTDQIEVTITASGYQTATVTRSAKDLAQKPQLSIGLKPAPKP